MNEVWERLSARDRKALIFCGVFLVLLFLYAGVWSPFKHATEMTAIQVEQQQKALTWMQANQALVRTQQRHQTNNKSRGSSEKSLLSVIDASLRNTELNQHVKRIEPSGDSEIKVRFENSAFDSLVIWLGALAKDQGIRATNVTVVRRDSEGLVDVQMVLSR